MGLDLSRDEVVSTARLKEERRKKEEEELVGKGREEICMCSISRSHHEDGFDGEGGREDELGLALDVALDVRGHVDDLVVEGKDDAVLVDVAARHLRPDPVATDIQHIHRCEHHRVRMGDGDLQVADGGVQIDLFRDDEAQAVEGVDLPRVNTQLERLELQGRADAELVRLSCGIGLL